MADPAASSRLSIPLGVRVPRLEQLLGRRLDELDYLAVERLVAERVAEDLTLEFKRELYARDEKGKDEQAKDPAAMANASGGLILLGVDEDDQGRAARLLPVPLSDSERTRMVTIIVQRIAPRIPDLLLVTELPDPANPTHGVYAIVVPASESGPHGITRNDGYAWPIREDTQVRYMREPELVDRFRNRFGGLQQQQTRAKQAFAEGLPRLGRGANAWLAIAASPARLGRLQLTRQTLQASRSWLAAQLPQTASGTAWSPDLALTAGRRRVIHSSQSTYQGVSGDWHAELHLDGTGFAAQRLEVEPTRAGETTGPPHIWLDTVAVGRWTATLLQLLAAHAVRAGGGGDLFVVTQLLGADAAFTFSWQDKDPDAVDRGCPEFRGTSAAAHR